MCKQKHPVHHKKQPPPGPIVPLAALDGLQGEFTPVGSRPDPTVGTRKVVPVGNSLDRSGLTKPQTSGEACRKPPRAFSLARRQSLSVGQRRQAPQTCGGPVRGLACLQASKRPKCLSCREAASFLGGLPNTSKRSIHIAVPPLAVHGVEGRSPRLLLLPRSLVSRQENEVAHSEIRHSLKHQIESIGCTPNEKSFFIPLRPQRRAGKQHLCTPE